MTDKLADALNPSIEGMYKETVRLHNVAHEAICSSDDGNKTVVSCEVLSGLMTCTQRYGKSLLTSHEATKAATPDDVRDSIDHFDRHFGHDRSQHHLHWYTIKDALRNTQGVPSGKIVGE